MGITPENLLSLSTMVLTEAMFDALEDPDLPITATGNIPVDFAAIGSLIVAIEVNELGEPIGPMRITRCTKDQESIDHNVEKLINDLSEVLPLASRQVFWVITDDLDTSAHLVQKLTESSIPVSIEEAIAVSSSTMNMDDGALIIPITPLIAYHIVYLQELHSKDQED